MDERKRKTSIDEFDWLVDYHAFRDVLLSWLQAKGFQIGQLSALVLGCGTSSLSRLLVEDRVCSSIVSIDVSNECILQQKKKNDGEDKLSWITADLNNVDDMHSKLGNSHFDLVFDKGTLDALMCEGDFAGYVHSVASFMRCGGAYILVSLHDAALLRPMLDFEASKDLELAIGRKLHFSCMNISVKDETEINRSFVTLLDIEDHQSSHRNSDMASANQRDVDLNKIRKHLNDTLQWYMTENAPLLTQARENKLREDFRAMKLARIPLDKAYQIMFSAEEQSEYTKVDFLSDLAATNLFPQDAKDQNCDTLGLEDMITFIRINQ